MTQIASINNPSSPASPTTTEAGRAGEAGFSKSLEQALEQVSQLQSDAETGVSDVLQGKGGDVHSAVLAVAKADLAFELMVQVRNKIVEAYQEISRLSF